MSSPGPNSHRSAEFTLMHAGLEISDLHARQQGKEVNAMKYAKPEVALQAHAIAAIKMGDPTKPPPYIILDLRHLESNGAYEADE
jgi:hypothetical protein